MVKKTTYTTDPNFLQGNKLTSYTRTGTQAQATDGIIQAGTIFPANDGTAEGVVYNTVDVSDGDKPISVIVRGDILAERLPVKPTAEAVEALKDIKFYGEGNEPYKVQA